MAKTSQITNTSTIVDLLLQSWLDQFPTDKTSALQDKYLSLDKTLRHLNEQYNSLATAKCRLSNLYKPLSDALNCLKDARFSQADFIKTYGDLGISTPTPYTTMDTTNARYIGQLEDYAHQVEKAYFANLESARNSIASIESLRNTYSNLFKAITTIRDSYFKSQPDRRKPIVRELYRTFDNIVSNLSFLQLDPTGPHTDQKEWESLLSICQEAAKTAKILKSAR